MMYNFLKKLGEFNMHSYKVSFTNDKGIEFDTAVFQETNEEMLEKLIRDYVNTKGFLNHFTTISWSAITIVAQGTITKPIVTEIEIDDTSDYGADKDVYCRSCGLRDGIKFEATYASGDYYRCEPCKVGFHA